MIYWYKLNLALRSPLFIINNANIENVQKKAEILYDYILYKFNNKNNLPADLLKKTYPVILLWSIIVIIKKIEKSIIRISNTLPEAD